MSSKKQEVNPFYVLVVLVGIAFVVTTLAYVVVLVRLQPVGGQAPTSVESPVPQFIEQRGESLLLQEAGALVVVSILAMGLDRWRSRRSSRAKEEVSPGDRT